MELKELFTSSNVSLDLSAGRKDDVLVELIGLLQLDEKAREMLFKMLKKRENLGSTGIGKGFALDCLAALLLDWDISQFLLRASVSTYLAGMPPSGEQGWLVRFGPTEDRRQLRLRCAALSGSGTAVKGKHIMDPSSGRPATRFQMAWAGASSAAKADAISTALMVMDDAAIGSFCERFPDCLAYALPCHQNQVRTFHAEAVSVYR